MGDCRGLIRPPVVIRPQRIASRPPRSCVEHSHWRSFGATLIFLALVGNAAAEEPGAMQLLAQMATAVRTLDYQGSFIYQHDGRIDALRIFHDAEAGQAERERLVSMSGPRSEVVRDGGSITYMQSGAPTVLLVNRAGARLLPLVPEAPAATLAQSYQARVGGADRVAGYGARIVDITPRDNYRYGYRVWLADTTHLLLRSQVRDKSDRSLEQFMFVALEVGAKPKESDLASSADAGITAAPQERALAGGGHWRVADAPRGFTLRRAQRPTQGSPDAEHLLYSDGLASVSVYVEPETATHVDHAMNRGVLNVYTHAADGWKFTALGDVPRATVERMALSVQAMPTPTR